MMSKIVTSGIVVTVTVVMATVLYASPSKRFDERTQMCRIINEGTLGWESQPWGLGNQKFQDVCKSCHSRDNESGAPFLHAKSFVSNGWNRVFARRGVKCAKNGSWDGLTEEELQIMNDFLYRNAAWTYDPYGPDSCG